MNWLLIKKFPKFAIVAGVLVISTGLFGLWWLSRKSGHSAPERSVVKADPRDAAIKEKIASLPAKIGWLALVGSDLYDVSTGERLFANWLSGIPQKLFYQPDTNKLMVHVERGVMRYGIDGKRDAAMGETSPPAFINDGKQALFIRGGDIWLADVDWKAFRFSNEKQATKLGQFQAGYFAANIMLSSDKALIVRQQNQLLRVNLKTGDVQPVKIPIIDMVKRRSPDGKFLFSGDSKGTTAYDVDTTDTRKIGDVGKIQDVRWLDNERCVFLTGGSGLALYDRAKNKVEQVAALPFPCAKIAGPSPGGRYVLCAGSKGIVVVDTKAKRAENFGMPAQHFGWVSEDTLIYSRDTMDTGTRGTWLKTMGQKERQVIGDPYTVGRDGDAAVSPMLQIGVVIFGTKDALFRMKPDGSELKEIAKLTRPVGRIQAVEVWGQE